jgi:hypothetical protein
VIVVAAAATKAAAVVAAMTTGVDFSIPESFQRLLPFVEAGVFYASM